MDHSYSGLIVGGPLAGQWVTHKHDVYVAHVALQFNGLTLVRDKPEPNDVESRQVVYHHIDQPGNRPGLWVQLPDLNEFEGTFSETALQFLMADYSRVANKIDVLIKAGYLSPDWRAGER